MTKKTLAILSGAAIAAVAAAVVITTLGARGTGTAVSANGRVAGFNFDALRIQRGDKITVNRAAFVLEAQDPDARGPVTVRLITLRGFTVDNATATMTGPATLTFVRRNNGQRIARTGTVRVIALDGKRPNNPTGKDRLAVRFEASGSPLIYEYAGNVNRGEIVVRKEVRN